MTSKQDAEYVAQSIATWANRLVEENREKGNDVSEGEGSLLEKGSVVVEERNHVFSQNVASDHHVWVADEPLEIGGSNLGPDPYEHLLAALGSCTSMTIRMYANRKKWPVEHVKVSLSHQRDHGKDCLRCDTENPQVDVISRKITLTGKLSEEQTQRLLEIADRCPVHKTLHGKLIIDTEISKN